MTHGARPDAFSDRSRSGRSVALCRECQFVSSAAVRTYSFGGTCHFRPMQRLAIGSLVHEDGDAKSGRRRRRREDGDAKWHPTSARANLAELARDRVNACAREWRNWQTRWLQVPVLERAWGFKSPLAHQSSFTECGRRLSCWKVGRSLMRPVCAPKAPRR